MAVINKYFSCLSTSCSATVVFIFLLGMSAPSFLFAHDDAAAVDERAPKRVFRPDESMDGSKEGSQIYGIFTGMANYPGIENDLQLTDQDALRARDALIEGAGMDPRNVHTLLNKEATSTNFRKALASVAADIGQDDMLVIFYSGHGERYQRKDGSTATDPDGMDESIEFYDGPLLDDELAALLDDVHAGTILLVLDSCYSGGFAKDVVSVPGRMGFFSSEEDVVSQAAGSFRAGGYLAAFFYDAIKEHQADQDRNNEITAMELSQYLHDRYRNDVKDPDAATDVAADSPQPSYQHLVVDRGGVGAQSVLFRSPSSTVQ